MRLGILGKRLGSRGGIWCFECVSTAFVSSSLQRSCKRTLVEKIKNTDDQVNDHR